MRREQFHYYLATSVAVLFTSLTAMGQVLNDPLQGSTTGTRLNGTFVTGGWRVDNEYDSIYWHIGTYSHGAFQYYVKGLPANSCPGPFNSKNELHETYDYTYNNADNQYAPGFQGDPYKEYFRKQCESGKENKMENLWQILPTTFEDDTAPLSWNPSSNYKFRIEWQNVGGNAIKYSYRNDALFWTQVISGSWNPAGNSVRIAASTRRGDEGASAGAIYSYVTAYDLNSYTPSAPTVSVPANGAQVKDQVGYIQWTGDLHTGYQVRLSTANDPNSGIIWDSQQMTSGRNFTWTGTMGNGTYYIFVRLANGGSWGAWSANGYSYTVNTSFSPSGTDYVQVNGDSYRNFSGAFLGLGFTHMRGLQRCKFDRTRYTNDLAYMSSKKYTYQRILSMVAWDGVEIAPVGFQGPTHFVNAWSDYDQQFKDMIDIAYDTYGIRTQVTIFADAQWVMPSDSTRISHLDRILADLVGREHKVVLLEIANEGFQNGFPDPNGYNDITSKAQYLADRTPIPVAGSSPGDTSDSGVYGAQSDNAFDIGVVHFSRDIGTVEGGWLPVRDSWRNGPAGTSPLSSNEPIGNGSSVASETDPIKLCMAGIFAWTANCVSYVFHCKAGIQGFSSCCPPSGTEFFFSTTAGSDSYANIFPLLPKDMSSWARNDGKESAAAFTSFSGGQANKWWPEVGGATDGCSRHIGSIKSGRFVTCPIGILGGGLTLQARRPMTLKVYNPLSGNLDYNLTKNANDTFTLAQGTGAYVIIGDFTDVPADPGGAGGTGILNIKPAGTITVDGNSSDWTLTDFVTKARGGQGTQGDIALVGFDGGSTVYRGNYVGVLPTSAADHTAKVYSRQNATYLYFLVRVDDNQIQTQNPVGSNWLNDCVEFYIDPANAGGSSPISNSSSDIQLVIDAANQKNVYMCTAGYTTQVLNGVTSAVTTDASGWWLEVRITKTALDPDITTNAIGLDFNFRDNDNNNDPALTTVYTWNESSTQGFPSKIPDHWGKGHMQSPFGGTNRTIPGIIQSEDFDNGGQGVAYNDTEVTNFGGAYRPSEWVDITTTADVGGGYIVGWINTGEWMEYTVNVNTTGDYAVKVRVASAGGGGALHMSIDGTNIFSARSFTDTGGWDTWTTIIVPGIFLSAGNNKILRITADVGAYNINYMDFAFGGADVVSVDMGSPNVNDGMQQIVCCDGNTVVSTLGGHYSQNNANVPDHYMYFEVSDGYAFQGSKNSATITFDYLDKNAGTSLQLNYDGAPGAYTVGPTENYTNSNTWKTAVWTVGDAYFGNRENGGSDFRIYYSGLDFYIDTVMVFATVGGSPPGVATNPSPATGATGVSITPTLTWTAGSGATSHDVRFGTVNPPPFIQNQAGTSYAPSTLNAGTLYYWRIDEKNGFGTTTGTVWSFTTGAAPGAASAPNPANGATAQYLTKTLSWTAGSGATSHDVRFGTVNPPPFVINQTATTYNPGTLAPSTTYYWRIDEKNSFGTTTGTVWNFVTASQSPFGGTARTIPGTIEGEDYDLGGEGNAYHDLSAGNAGGQYRSDNVDIATTADTGGGYVVGWIDAGEWLEYTVNVTNTGDHTFKMRVASCCSGGTFTLKMNNSTIASGKSFTSTGGWDTWTTILVPAIFLSAGNNQILQVYMDAAGWNLNKVDVSFGGADCVSEDLGPTNTDDGMTHPVCCDGMTTSTSIFGHNCHKNVSNTADRYMYFAIFDIWAFQGNRPNVWITVEYYDTGTSTLGLNYDATSSAYKDPGGAVVLVNSNTWKTKSWNVTDGYFGNRENGGADYRIYMTGTSAWYLDTVQTSTSQP